MSLHRGLDLLPVEVEAQDAEATVTRHRVAFGGCTRHPHGRMRLLNWLGDDAAGRNLNQLAIIFEDVFSPRFDDDVERFAYFGTGAIVIDTEAVEFLRGGR